MLTYFPGYVLTFTAVLAACEAAKTQCYDDIGCFSNEAPFNDLPLPMSPEKIAPKFYLLQSDRSFRLINTSLELKSAELVLTTHGWNGGYNDKENGYKQIINNLADIKQADYVFIDWQVGASNGFGLNLYTQPASNTRVIGPLVQRFLESNPNFNPSKTHCIGFSMGSHVCGFFAKSLTKGKLARISALDPAGPNFDKNDTRARVDSSDAGFVDVIHTSWCGLQIPVGHVDFWANDNNLQPGCLTRRRRQSRAADFTQGFFGCSHFRAQYLYAETIKVPENCSFKFCPCESMQTFKKGKCNTCDDVASQQVGYWSINGSARGSFYGKTTNKAPFCIDASNQKKAI